MFCFVRFAIGSGELRPGFKNSEEEKAGRLMAVAEVKRA